MSSPSQTVKCRVLCISDTHSDQHSNEFSEDKSFRPPFPKADILIHAGDLTQTGTIAEHKAALELLRGFDAELKLVIAGNHELSLHRSYYHANPFGPGDSLTFGFRYDKDAPDLAEELWTGQAAKAAGVTYLTEGLHTFSLSNGAKFTVYASPWQPEFFNWAFNYPFEEDRWNPPALIASNAAYQMDVKNGGRVVPTPPERDPHPVPEGAVVDLCITHGPSWDHLDTCEPSGFKAGCPHLLRMLARIRPRLHVCGHIHEGWGAEMITWPNEAESVPRTESAGAGKMMEQTTTLGATDDIIRGSSKRVIRADDDDVKERRAAFLDVSSDGGHPLKYGSNTLMVNAAVVNVYYRPDNAAWLVDMDLPTGCSIPI